MNCYCGLDAEKAFDSCNWDILFEKLYYEKQLPLSVTNVIKSLYINSSAKVLYNGYVSEEFSLSQGVHQGSVLSPHLYNMYIEELLKESIQSQVHLYMVTTYTGITMYADDIILMSTTLNGLQKFVDKCVEISKK